MNKTAYIILFLLMIVTIDAKACRRTAVLRTKAMIDVVLKDVMRTHAHKGGGGISEIKVLATGLYRVSILQEKRIEEITYQLTSDTQCEVSIVKRTESVRSMGKEKAPKTK